MGKSTSGSALANFSPDGRVICRNFNQVKGWSLADCHFAHVCNRQVNGRACGLAHPSHSHFGVRGSVQAQGSSARSSWLPLASPLNTDLWLAELIGDKDEAFLTDGILHGFKLALEDLTFLPAQQNNYKSATSAAHKPKVEQNILGKIVDGNYVVTDVKPTIISAVGAIPKPDSSEVWLIHDCSRPPGRALNDYISCSSFKFQTLDDALKMLQPNYFMAKIDLRHAYRSVPIHKSNYMCT